MEYLSIRINKNEQDLLKIIYEDLPEKIPHESFETKKFNGDLGDVIVTILIPVTVPFLAVLFQKLITTKPEIKEHKKIIEIAYSDKKLYFENSDIEDVRAIIRELSAVEQDDKPNR